MCFICFVLFFEFCYFVLWCVLKTSMFQAKRCAGHLVFLSSQLSRFANCYRQARDYRKKRLVTVVLPSTTSQGSGLARNKLKMPDEARE